MEQFATYIEYLTLEKNYSKHTVLAYQKDLEAFAVFCKKENDILYIKECNYAAIRNWIVYLLDLGVANKTINRKIASLKSYYKFLLKTEQIKVSPLLKHKALKTAKKIQVPFSEKEMSEVLKGFNFENTFQGKRDQLIIELFYATGIRKAELINLKISDVAVDQKTIKVLGKRNKERIIPVSSKLLKTIKEYLSYRREVSVKKETEELFITQKGVKIYNSFVYRIINSYFSRASSKVKKSPHVLRHTFATHLLNEGADLNAVKELLGHTSLAATQVYTHNSIAKLKKAHQNAHPRNK